MAWARPARHPRGAQARSLRNGRAYAGPAPTCHAGGPFEKI